MYDTAALGELLVDFTSSGKSSCGNTLFEANPGGAPCNVLSMLTRLGRKTAFIGKVGNDVFGRMLKQAIEEEGIDTQGLIADDAVSTTLAVVNNCANGERDFSFFRKPGADTCLKENEINLDIIKNSRVFHFGSLSLTDEPSASATVKAVRTARESGCIISYDPNLRISLWKNPVTAKEKILWGASRSDIVKVASEELEFITGESITENGVKSLLGLCGNIKLLLVTKGSSGSECCHNGVTAHADAFLTDKTIDTTGAGDAFMGCVISYVLDKGLELNEAELYEMLEFANRAASIVTTRHGALRSMPNREEIDN